MTIKFKQNLGKKEIIENLSSVIGFSYKNIQKITEEIIEIIVSDLKDKKKINLNNLGTLRVVFKKERDGRNPKTNEKFKISSRNTIQFKASESLKKKLN